MKKITYSVVVPVYNEEESIYPFYERTLKIMEAQAAPFEIIFVDDGSKDNTCNILADLHNTDKRIRVIELSRNFGKETALTAGIDFSIGEAVIPIDVDLQDPPEIIPRLVEKWKEGYDVVYAMRSERKGESFFKRTTASLFYKTIKVLTNCNIPRNTGDFRLMDRKVVDSLKELKESNRFMKGLFSWVGYNQTAFLYQRDPRLKGKTKWNYPKLFNFAIEGITSFSITPLRFASVFGFIISLFALIYAGYIFMRTLFLGIDVPGYPSLIVIVLFLGGIQLLSIGIIGEYLGRIYMETKKRPLYFIKRMLGVERQDRVKKNINA